MAALGSRPSTSFKLKGEGVDDRDKPGHEGVIMVQTGLVILRDGAGSSLVVFDDLKGWVLRLRGG